jgi:hypothetical protein
MNILAMLGLAWVRWAVVAAVAAGLVASFAYSNQRKGAEKLRAKIERSTNERVSKADSAGRKSADPTSSGVRNPNYRD